MERLTEAELATMREKHVVNKWGFCSTCLKDDHPDVRGLAVEFPCDAARLLAHLTPGPVPHLAGIAQAHCHCGAKGMEMTHPRHER